MSPDTSNHELLEAWKQGDDDAAAMLFQRYQARLLALVRSRLSRKLARRLDPEDVLLSAYRSFFLAARNGRAVPAADDDLWPLLTTFALRKLAHQARRHQAERRDISREQLDDSLWLQSVVSDEPEADHAAVLTDEVERLLKNLDATAAEVLVRSLQGADPNSIASALGITERTVRRALERVRQEIESRSKDTPALVGISVSPQRASPPPRILPARHGTTTWNQYLLQEHIGSGAFSKVYRALDRVSDEVVAVKFLRRDCWNDPRAAEALVREYEILTRLRHPHILRMRAWGTTPRGALFLVTDHVAGGNLGDWRASTQPSVSQIVNVGVHVAEAVAVAHAAGVWHGDLKPANVLRGDNGEIVLCDFGLARYASEPDDVPHGGTAGFLCPELITDVFGPVTERSDVYGIGALLYALLTGRPPMSGRDLPETLANVLSRSAPEPPSSAGALSTPELDAVVLRCLRKEPMERYHSVQDVANDLALLDVI